MLRHFLATILFGIMLIGLSACISPEEARRQDEAACRSYGFQQGTADFAACLQREVLARRYGYDRDIWFNWHQGPGWY